MNGGSVVPGIVGALRRGWRSGGRLALRLEELVCHGCAQAERRITYPEEKAKERVSLCIDIAV